MRTENLHRFLKYCLLCLVIIFLPGCITTFPADKLPTTREAFHKTPEQLHADYPVISEYDSTSQGFLNVRMTTLGAKQLVSAWGEPDNKRTEWSYAGYMGATLVGCGFLFGPLPALITSGMVVAIRPYPFEYYYWRKEDYCIEAKIDTVLSHAYRESLIYWNWHHMNDGKNIPPECTLQTKKTENLIQRGQNAI